MHGWLLAPSTLSRLHELTRHTSACPKLFPGIQIRSLPAGVTNRVGPLSPDSGRGDHVPRGGQLYLYRQ